jgi:DNA-directed RNA polymerase specialized sigma24 family protein
MDTAPQLAAAADSSDPRTGLRAVAALRRLLEQLEALQVANAREHGWSWQEIAEVLGVSRQAVHKKHANRAHEAGGGPAAALRDRLTRGGTRNA